MNDYTQAIQVVFLVNDVGPTTQPDCPMLLTPHTPSLWHSCAASESRLKQETISLRSMLVSSETLEPRRRGLF